MNKLKIMAAIVPAGVVCLADTIIKMAVDEGYFDIRDASDICSASSCGNSILDFRRLHNKGVARGILRSKPEVVRALSTALTGANAGYIVKRLLSDDMKTGGLAGLSLMLGGGLSNTADRLKKGYVVDYFSFKFGPDELKNLVFNISDMAILAGTILYICSQIKSGD